MNNTTSNAALDAKGEALAVEMADPEEWTVEIDRDATGQEGEDQ